MISQFIMNEQQQKQKEIEQKKRESVGEIKETKEWVQTLVDDSMTDYKTNERRIKLTELLDVLRDFEQSVTDLEAAQVLQKMQTLLKSLKPGDQVDCENHRGFGLYYFDGVYLYKTTGIYGYYLPSAAFEMVEKYGIDYFKNSGAARVLLPVGETIQYRQEAYGDQGEEEQEETIEESDPVAVEIQHLENESDYVIMRGKRYQLSLADFQD